MSVAMERHDKILRAAVEQANGRVVKVTGDGLMAVFSSPAEAAEGSLHAQLALQDEAWGETGPLRVRMGIHAGEAQQRAGDFFGPPVNRTARIMAAGHGGQVLLSAARRRARRSRSFPQMPPCAISATTGSRISLSPSTSSSSSIPLSRATSLRWRR